MARKRPNLTVSELDVVQESHIIEAIHHLKKAGLPPNYKQSTDYDLVMPDGELYPPLATMAQAYSFATGKDLPEGLKGGKNTATFIVLSKLGFRIQRKFQLSFQDLLSYVELHSELKLRTIAQDKEFTIISIDNGIEILIKSSRKRLTLTGAYLERHVTQFNKTRSFQPKDYNHIASGSSYFLALVRKILRGRGFSEVELDNLAIYSPTTDRETLEYRVREIQKDKDRNPAKGNTKPRKVSVTSEAYERDSAVVADVLDRANGICELCGTKAPFVKKDGQPYLEVHHIIPLAEKGPDITDNAVALCPNCHREAHYGTERLQKRKELLNYIKGLKH